MIGHLFIFRGIPASGKSSIAWAMRDVGLLDLVVTRDDIREELEPGRRCVDRERMTDAGRVFEARVLRVRDERIVEGLRAGLRVASADTNLSGTAVRELYALAESLDLERSVTVITIDAPEGTCVERDRLRDRPVGEDVIRRMASDWYWQRR